MDVWFFGNPLKFLWEVAPTADMAVSTEVWINDHTFKGDVCLAHGEECPFSRREGSDLKGRRVKKRIYLSSHAFHFHKGCIIAGAAGEVTLMLV